MFNFRGIKAFRRKTVLGELFRLPFRLIPPKMVMRVISGPLKGKKWINDAHNVSVWLGTYERKQTELFVLKSKGKKVLWDLGAHVGYYTLLFLSRNQNSSAFCFEPLERNNLYFKEHMKLNGIKDYELFAVAVSDREDILSFTRGKSTVAGKLSETGEMQIKAIKLSDWFEEGKMSCPDVIKIDIEGAEVDVLNDIKDLLKTHKPTLFLSTHGQNVHDDCVLILRSLGYTLTPLDKGDLQNARELLAEFD